MFCDYAVKLQMKMGQSSDHWSIYVNIFLAITVRSELYSVGNHLLNVKHPVAHAGALRNDVVHLFVCSFVRLSVACEIC